MLWLFQRVFFGPLTNPENKNLKDLTVRELRLSWCRSSCSASGSASIRKPFFRILEKPVEPRARQGRPEPGAGSARRSPAPGSRQPRWGSSHARCRPDQEFLLLSPEILLAHRRPAAAPGRHHGPRLRQSASRRWSRSSAWRSPLASCSGSSMRAWSGAARSILGGTLRARRLLLLLEAAGPRRHRALTVLIAYRFVEEGGYRGTEYYSLLLFATAGMMFMASGYTAC